MRRWSYWCLPVLVGCTAYRDPTPPPQARSTSDAELAPSTSVPDQPTQSLSQCLAEPLTLEEATIEPELPVGSARLARCDAERTEAQSSCRMVLAREYISANHIASAIPILLRVAHTPAAVEAPEAALLALERLNSVGTHTQPPRSICFDAISDELPSLMHAMCSPKPRIDAKRACAVMSVIDVDLTRCSECVTSTVTGRAPSSAYRFAAEMYLELAHECDDGRRNDDSSCLDDACRALDAALRAHAYASDKSGASEELRLASESRRVLLAKGPQSRCQALSRWPL